MDSTLPLEIPHTHGRKGEHVPAQKRVKRAQTTHIAVAPSARILAYLARKASAQSPCLALTVVPLPAMPEPEPFEPPATVLITPCDPWPRPYYLEDGLRKVHPYHFTYNTFCKERWRGKGLLEIFTKEFRDRPLTYYREAIESGKVTINGKQVPSVDYVVRNGDVISHTLHRHEPPVTAQAIGIIHEDEDMIVINKPAGVPVHPAGRYNYNSVVELMRSDRGYSWNPMPCNRLDRLTSGIMFVGKHAKAAEDFGIQLKGRTVRKEYVARVVGEFPEGDVVCTQPIRQISPKLGLNRVRADGKDARTVFRRLAYYPVVSGPATLSVSSGGTPKSANDKELEGKMPWKQYTGYSIVRCMPLTGRTHQLRVHLQYLGHPIANDPIYCNQRVFGPDLGIGDDSSDRDEDIISRLSRMGKDQVAEALAYHEEMVAGYDKKKGERMTGELCEVCDTPLYSDPGPHELGIYLHAKRYECAEGRWTYETDLPRWALPPGGASGATDVADRLDPSALANRVPGLSLEEENGEQK